jgi:hypothetical protein
MLTSRESNFVGSALLSLQLKLFVQCFLESIPHNCDTAAISSVAPPAHYELSLRALSSKRLVVAFLAAVDVDMLRRRCVSLGVFLNIIKTEDAIVLQCATSVQDGDVIKECHRCQCLIDASLALSALPSAEIGITDLMHSLLARIKNVLSECLPAFPANLSEVRVELTGAGEDGYMGDFMLEYEINPAAGGFVIYWPNILKFSEAHIERFTLGYPGCVLEVLMMSVLTDLPHEMGHVLQNAYKQVISPKADDGWLAEHDPSIISLNLLRRALMSPAQQQLPASQQSTGSSCCDEGSSSSDRSSSGGSVSILKDDGLSLPGLMETILLWFTNRTKVYHNRATSVEQAAYARWKSSCGYCSPAPDVDHASIACDYMKMRAAIESYPIDIGQQLRELFEYRVKDIRAGERPPIAMCHASTMEGIECTVSSA